MKKTYILGHKSPDTDCVSAVKAYEWYLKKQGVDAVAVVLGKLNNETKWLFDYFDVEPPVRLRKMPSDCSIIICDTTEAGQLPHNLGEAEILEIWDHHNLGGLKTARPIKAIIDVVGSTCTLFVEYFQRKNIGIATHISGLLLGAIISDTLNLTSPTTTNRDRQAYEYLESILELDLKKFTKQQFVAKSSIENMTIKEIVKSAAKTYHIYGHKIKISTFETVDPSKPWEVREQIREFCLAEKEKKGYDYYLFFVIDIMNRFAKPLYITDAEKDLIENAFGVKFRNGMRMEGVVSRKQQIIPPIEDYLEQHPKQE